MNKPRGDHALAEEIAKHLDDTPSGGRGPGADASVLLQQARNAGEGGLRAHYLAQAQRAIRKLDPARQGNLIQRLQAEVLALQGRGGDTKVAHVTPGEIVIPKSLQTPQLLAWLRAAAQAQGIDPSRLVVGSNQNAINPNTGQPEFGIGDWFSGWFDGGQSQDDAEDATNLAGAAQGATARAAAARINAANVRADYIDKVRALDPLDNAGREAIKAQAREATPPEIRAGIVKVRGNYLGARSGSTGSANITNPAFNQAARELGVAGKGLLGANVVLGLADTAMSDNPVRAGVANVSAVGGGLLGGAAGAPVGPVGAFIGSGLGGVAGYKAGEEAYDYLNDWWNKR